MSEPTYGHNPPPDDRVRRPLPPAHRPGPYLKVPTSPAPRSLLARLRARLKARR